MGKKPQVSKVRAKSVGSLSVPRDVLKNGNKNYKRLFVFHRPLGSRTGVAIQVAGYEDAAHNVCDLRLTKDSEKSRPHCSTTPTTDPVSRGFGCGSHRWQRIEQPSCEFKNLRALPERQFNFSQKCFEERQPVQGCPSLQIHQQMACSVTRQRSNNIPGTVYFGRSSREVLG